MCRPQELTANCGPEKKVSVRQSRGGKSRKGGVNISRSDEYTGQSKDSDQESRKASQEIE